MPQALWNPSPQALLQGQALDAVHSSVALQSVALAATAAMDGGQGKQAHAPSPVEPWLATGSCARWTDAA